MREANTLTVVVLESHVTTIHRCTWNASETVLASQVAEWDSSKYHDGDNGIRLFEEVARRVRESWASHGGRTDGVVVSLPGTLADSENIVSSSRLGIRQPLPVAQLLSAALSMPCRVFHDVECLAIGEDRRIAHKAGKPRADNATLVYIFVEEGVGSKAIINGKTHVGAGAAGILGRLTVQPEGAYFKALAARGPLEVFASRPWVSENLVGTYLSEKDKLGFQSPDLENSRFRLAVRMALERDDWRSLNYEHIADGITIGDPLIPPVLDVAARYLGFAINCVITVLHPHNIVLGGLMLTELPGFADRVVEHARRYSWPNAWNTTSLVVSSAGRGVQVEGAVHLWLSTMELKQ